MRVDLRFTLLPEGTSDRALVPILEWVLSQHYSAQYWTIVPSVVQSDRLPMGRVSTLVERIKTAVAVYPCEILFVHRDSDCVAIEDREMEIRNAVECASPPNTVSPIAVIPVRMTEAWLLIDESAIRKAAGFANGKMALHLPATHELERRARPQNSLAECATCGQRSYGPQAEKF